MDLQNQPRGDIARSAARTSLVFELDQLRWAIQDGAYIDALRRASDRAWLRASDLEHLPHGLLQRVHGWIDIVLQCLREPVDAEGASRALMHAVDDVNRS